MTMPSLDPADIALPALLRHARNTYGAAMREALEQGGYDDIPKNGLYVIGALALGRAPLAQIIRELQVTKQAAGQLVDALVSRGYLAREVDPEDRRRLTVTLTVRGRGAAAVQAAAREVIDDDLVARVGIQKVKHARSVLAALIDIGAERRTRASE